MKIQFLATENSCSYASFKEAVPADDLTVCSPSDIFSHIKKSGSEKSVFYIISVTADEYVSFPDFNLTDWNKNFVFILFGPFAEGNSGDDFKNIEFVSDWYAEPVDSLKLKFIIKKAEKILNARYKDNVSRCLVMDELEEIMHNQQDLINIGISLSAERDPKDLLRLILFLSKKITGADAGSIYLIESDNKGGSFLRFKASDTFSRNLPFSEFTLPMNKESIAGYVAVTGETLNIPDVYNISSLNLGLTHNSSFDKANNYLSKTMLVVPMVNQQNSIIGVIQLINSKRHPDSNRNRQEAFSITLKTPDDFNKFVVPFDTKFNGLLKAIAAQASVAIESNRLIKQVKIQFDSFVKASVDAVESLDPATSGHSERVAKLSLIIAEAVNNEKTGYLAGYSFSESDMEELNFAALLHDFGKLYVNINIIRKEKKLFPHDLNSLMLRLDYLYRFIEVSSQNHTASGKKAGTDSKTKLLQEIVRIKEKIKLLNEPAVFDNDLEKDLSSIYSAINSIPCLCPDGNSLVVMTEENRDNLGIKRGSLNTEERKEIESHVTHSFNFLQKIPWPLQYRRIPEIVLRHHERINGSGYPDGLNGREATLLQSRIIAVADVFDALTASDRPYKPAVPVERVLVILKEEADKWNLDPDLVRIFLEKKLYLKAEIKKNRT